MADVPAVATLLREQVADSQRLIPELRADTDGLRRQVEDLRAQVASLQQERAAVDPQEHAAVSAEKRLLLLQLDDRRAENAQLRAVKEAGITRLCTEQLAAIARLHGEKNAAIAQLRTEKDAEIARLQAVAASQLARLEAVVHHVAVFTVAPALEAREVDSRKALVAEEDTAAKELPPQPPCVFWFDATVPRAPHVTLDAATHRVATWGGDGDTTLRATQPLTPHRNRWRVRVQRNTRWVGIGVVPAAPPAPRTMADYGGGYSISDLGGWEMWSYSACGGAAAPGGTPWALEGGATVPFRWFTGGCVVECALDFAARTLQMTSAGTVLRGVLVGWAGEAAPLYPAVSAGYQGTVLELLP